MIRQKFCLILLLAIPLTALFQDSDILFAQATKSKNKKDSTKNITLPFDTSIAQLSPKFIGHNFKDIFNKLQARQEQVKEKNEFETTQEFEKRKDKEATKPITGKIYLESILSFRIDDCVTTYNADTETLNIVCPFTWAPAQDLSSDFIAVQWKAESIDKGTFLGTNAFGATVEVTREEYKYFNIAVKNYNSFEIGRLDTSRPWEERGFVAKIHLTPNEAKKIKSQIKSLLVCRLISPFVYQNQKFEKATFKWTYETTRVINYIYVTALELWFFDYSTGKVLFKTKTNPQN